MRISFPAACGAVLALALVAAPAAASRARAAGPAGAPATATVSGTHTFAVIGDTPYAAAALAAFPAQIAQLNADPAVDWVDHLGDIKDGGTTCSDAYLAAIKADFDLVDDPLVYTVGDNEWADCRRVSAGSYDPIERLARLRQVFFAAPGWTLGVHPEAVLSQSALGVPENVRWTKAGVDFAAVDVVGSDNDLAVWAGNSGRTARQWSEELARTAAVGREISDTFADARRSQRRAVVLLMQADMFDPAVSAVAPTYRSAFHGIVATIAREAAAFNGPVYLFNGDSHVYRSDQPLAAGSRWLSFYGLAAPVPNLTRVTVDGSSRAVDYLRVTVHDSATEPQSPVLTWTKVPFAA